MSPKKINPVGARQGQRFVLPTPSMQWPCLAPVANGQIVKHRPPKAGEASGLGRFGPPPQTPTTGEASGLGRFGPPPQTPTTGEAIGLGRFGPPPQTPTTARQGQRFVLPTPSMQWPCLAPVANGQIVEHRPPKAGEAIGLGRFGPPAADPGHGRGKRIGAVWSPRRRPRPRARQSDWGGLVPPPQTPTTGEASGLGRLVPRRRLGRLPRPYVFFSLLPPLLDSPPTVAKIKTGTAYQRTHKRAGG